MTSPPPSETDEAQSNTVRPTQSYRFDGFNSLLSCQPCLSLRLSSHLQNTKVCSSLLLQLLHRHPLHTATVHTKKKNISSVPYTHHLCGGIEDFPSALLFLRIRGTVLTLSSGRQINSSSFAHRGPVIRPASKQSATQPKHLSKRDQASPPILHYMDVEADVRRQPSLGTELVWT